MVKNNSMHDCCMADGDVEEDQPKRHPLHMTTSSSFLVLNPPSCLFLFLLVHYSIHYLVLLPCVADRGPRWGALLGILHTFLVAFLWD